MKTRRTSRAQRIVWLSPWLSGALLITLAIWLPNRTVLSETAELRKAEVAETMNAVPYIIGRWAGEDWPVPQEAQELLRPNATFSRRYVATDAPWVHVLLVHCSDARDMLGHYPPVCYPANGYVQITPDGPAEMEIAIDTGSSTGTNTPSTAGKDTLPVRLYRFDRMQEQDVVTQLQVFNAFILPDGTVTRRMDDINRQSERLAVSVQGVAQLQIITNGRVAPEQAAEIASELLSGMPDLIDTLLHPASGSEGSRREDSDHGG